MQNLMAIFRKYFITKRGSWKEEAPHVYVHFKPISNTAMCLSWDNCFSHLPLLSRTPLKSIYSLDFNYIVVIDVECDLMTNFLFYAYYISVHGSVVWSGVQTCWSRRLMQHLGILSLCPVSYILCLVNFSMRWD